VRESYPNQAKPSRPVGRDTTLLRWQNTSMCGKALVKRSIRELARARLVPPAPSGIMAVALPANRVCDPLGGFHAKTLGWDRTG
jgi:hypothetical protein